MANDMDMKTAIQTGDAAAVRRLVTEDASRANGLIHWGENAYVHMHPLHFVSDMLFDGTLAKGKELPLIDALISAGADLDFQRDREDGRKSDTPLIGAASLGAEEVGIRLLEAGARPDLRGLFGDTALHWAAFLGEEFVASWMGDPRFYNRPAGNHGRQREVAAILVCAGAIVEPEWLESEAVRRDAAMLAALCPGMP
jgi:hypothetical protein